MIGQNQKLTVESFRALAELSHSSGFALLCDVLQADVDDLSNSLATAETDETDRRLLSQWRALRTVLGSLHGIPDWAEEQITLFAANGDMASQAFLGEPMTADEADAIYNNFTTPPPSSISIKPEAKPNPWMASPQQESFEGLDNE